MAVRIIKDFFSGKRKDFPITSLCYDNGEIISGMELADRSIVGHKYCREKIVASGRFINGHLNGQGKRFSDGRIMCEGNFVDGELVGEGKMYSHLGHVIYEGTFARKPNDYGSAYHGHGREYHYQTGALLYEGEFYYNHWRGKGKEYYPNGQLRYEGEFLDSFWHGRGQHYNQKGQLVYDGDFEEEPFSYDR